MYLTHYNIEIKPFESSPDPRFVWLGEKHLEALAALKFGIRKNNGFILLTGEAGTGKTTLIKYFSNENDTGSILTSIPDPDLTVEDFFRLLSNELDIGIDFKTRGEFVLKFKDYLDHSCADQQKVLLIFDEAQRLNHQLLEQIRLLATIEKRGEKLLSTLLVGQSDLPQCVLNSRKSGFPQKIDVHYHIEPLTEAEIRDYINHRLQVAGSNEKIFSFEAISEIFVFSKGCPRLINTICDRCLLTGFAAGISRIDPKIVRKCADELTLPGEREYARKKPGADEKKKSDREATREKADTEISNEHNREAAEQAFGVEAMINDDRESADAAPEVEAITDNPHDAAEKKPESTASEYRPFVWGPGAAPRALRVSVNDQESPCRGKSMRAPHIIMAGLTILILTAISLYFWLVR